MPNGPRAVSIGFVFRGSQRPIAVIATLGTMSSRRSYGFALLALAVSFLIGPGVLPAVAAPTSVSSARVNKAVSRFEAAQKRSAQIDAKLTRSSAQLDDIVAEQDRARDRLSTRAQAMYRFGDTGFLSVLMGASTFQEFITRWDMLTRIGSEDARVLRDLKVARAQAERSSKTLLRLQDESARAVDAVAREVQRARKQFAASQTALQAYRARTSTSDTKPTPVKPSSPPAFKGSGAWKTGVASHYGRNFRGRGASGEKIGPYSMMVAHKTLAFGTLIEFEYDGKRAVARVADRGPRSAARDFDLGPGAVRVLDFNGVHEVRYRIIRR